VASLLPADSAERKRIPLCTGVLDYFSAALAEVAKVSHAGNEKHNPGQPLHWSREKSNDHADCILRHLMERGKVDASTGMRHSAEMAWRALALLEEELEAEGAPASRASTFPASTQPKPEEHCVACGKGFGMLDAKFRVGRELLIHRQCWVAANEMPGDFSGRER
jgi:hypothetical protein